MGCLKLSYYNPTLRALEKNSFSHLRVVEKKGARVKKCLNYYPFGMLMPGRHASSGDYRYGYQGSEKDNEIRGGGNSYTTFFRQLDPRLGRWLSVDPKASSRESPYVSMGNSPVKYNDQLGDTIRVDRKGKSYVYDGEQLIGYSGGDEFIDNALSALNTLYSGVKGQELLSELIDSKYVTTIKKGGPGQNEYEADKDKRAEARGVRSLFQVNNDIGGRNRSKTKNIRGSGKGSGGTVYWDPAKTNYELDNNIDGSRTSSNFTNLGHELSHGLDAIRGTMNHNSIFRIKRTEIFATHWENMLKAEHGLPLRQNYGRNRNGGFGILHPNGKSIFYSNSKRQPYDYNLDISDSKKF